MRVTRPPRSLPRARGPLGSALAAALLQPPGASLPEPQRPAGDTTLDEDVQVTLLMAHELHHSGWQGVDPAWEWHPALLTFVRPLEEAFERDLRRLAGEAAPAEGPLADQLFALAAEDGSPSLAGHVAVHATREQALEYLQHRSLVQLKEADAQTWLVPRLRGTPKGVLIEVQADEYGGGDPEKIHSGLWAKAMRGAGLDDSENHHVDVLPAASLAVLNAQTLFGLQARLAPAGVGFFTMVEITSSVPMRKYARGLERLGFGEEVTHYFHEHIAADASHEQLMARELVDAWVAAEPEVAHDLWFGARACVALDARLAAHCLDAWADGRSSLVAS